MEQSTKTQSWREMLNEAKAQKEEETKARPEKDSQEEKQREITYHQPMLAHLHDFGIPAEIVSLDDHDPEEEHGHCILVDGVYYMISFGYSSWKVFGKWESKRTRAAHFYNEHPDMAELARCFNEVDRSIERLKAARIEAQITTPEIRANAIECIWFSTEAKMYKAGMGDIAKMVLEGWEIVSQGQLYDSTDDVIYLFVWLTNPMAYHENTRLQEQYVDDDYRVIEPEYTGDGFTEEYE